MLLENLLGCLFSWDCSLTCTHREVAGEAGGRDGTATFQSLILQKTEYCGRQGDEEGLAASSTTMNMARARHDNRDNYSDSREDRDKDGSIQLEEEEEAAAGGMFDGEGMWVGTYLKLLLEVVLANVPFCT